MLRRIGKGRAPARVIDLGQAARLVGLPTAIHFQREANKWRLAKRALAIEAGILPLKSPAAELDFLDCLRSELNLRGGLVLGNLHLARAITRDYPNTEIVLGNDRSGIEFAEVSGWLARERGRVRVYHPKRVGRWMESLRQSAYGVKCRLRTRFASRPKIAAPTGQYPLLAIARMPGHLADMLPVLKLLRDEQGIDSVLSVIDGRLNVPIAEAGFSVYPLCDYGNGEARALAPQVRDAIFHLRGILEESSDEANFDELQNALLANRTRQVLREFVPQVLDVAVGVARLVEQFRPQLLLLGNPYTLEGRTATHVARHYGVRTAVIEHGSIFPNDPIWQECLVDAVCVWGEPSRRALLTCSVPDERISVTGAPRHDQVFHSVAEGQFQSSDAPVVLVAASGPGDNVNFIRYQAYIGMLYEAADLTPEVRWVVKLHKKDHEEYYRQVRPEGHPNVQIVRGQYVRDGVDIFDYLRPARALVTITSTTAMDAMAVDVPVITVDLWSPGKGMVGVEFLHRGCTTKVTSGRELAEAARQAWRGMRDPAIHAEARKYSREHFANPGSAARSVAERFISLIESSVHAA